MTDSKNIQIITLINSPVFPEIPSTGNINPWADTKIEEYQKLVENLNREVETDKNLLDEMKRVYDGIEDAYKKILSEIIKYSIVKDNAVGTPPDMRFKGSTKSILISLGITLGVPMLLKGAALYAQYIIRGLEAQHIALQAAVMAGQQENMVNIANLEARLLRMYRVVRVLRAGTWIVLAATLIWSGYEIYSSRNDTIRQLNKVRDDLHTRYDDYNKLANYQMEQARMLRNLVLSFHLNKEGKESLIFELNNKKYNFDKIFERSLCEKAEERKKMSEDQDRIATEKELINDMKSLINSILTENLNQVKGFNKLCETAFKCFQDGKTIEEFKELAQKIHLDSPLTDEQLQIIADESKKATTLDQAKFFEIYVPDSITRYYKLDQETQRIVAEE